MFIDKQENSFSQVLARISKEELYQRLNSVTHTSLQESISKASNEEFLTSADLINFLSPIATPYIEQMAQAASRLHLKYFGKVVTLYQPLYLANYCENECVYCGFNCKNRIERKMLSFEQIEAEAKAMHAQGEIKQVLILTGEAPKKTGLEYIKRSIQIMEKYMDSVSIEVYPMSSEDYAALKEVGCDGLTVYQETYDEKRYKGYHLSGQKKDFKWRLDTPERGAKAGLRSIGIGALYGLSDCRYDAFCTAMHALYLSDKYLKTEFSLSLPRIQPAAGGFVPVELMDDTMFVQTLLAFRLFLPRLGINVSTRESRKIRDGVLGLGATRFSAGSRTTVGGYEDEIESDDQFNICDNRSVAQMKSDLKAMGYQPVHKDWQFFLEGQMV